MNGADDKIASSTYRVTFFFTQRVEHLEESKWSYGVWYRSGITWIGKQVQRTVSPQPSSVNLWFLFLLSDLVGRPAKYQAICYKGTKWAN